MDLISAATILKIVQKKFSKEKIAKFYNTFTVKIQHHKKLYISFYERRIYDWNLNAFFVFLLSHFFPRWHPTTVNVTKHKCKKQTYCGKTAAGLPGQQRKTKKTCEMFVAKKVYIAHKVHDTNWSQLECQVSKKGRNTTK